MPSTSPSHGVCFRCQLTKSTSKRACVCVCVCAEREAELCELWQVPVSCCSCQLQLQVAIPVRGCQCERVKKQWAIANYLTPFQHADTAGLHYMQPSPLFTTLPACHCASCCMRRHFLCCCKAFAKFSLADLFVSFIARGIQISIQSLQAFHM